MTQKIKPTDRIFAGMSESGEMVIITAGTREEMHREMRDIELHHPSHVRHFCVADAGETKHWAIYPDGGPLASDVGIWRGKSYPQVAR